MSYTIFTRNWWIKNANYPGGLEPGPGPKRVIKIVDTEKQARDYCEDYNATHDPGKLSRKAEYTKN